MKRKMKTGINKSKQKYEVVSILHNGRKNIRYMPVNESKYDNIVGSIIILYNVDKIEDYRLLDEMVMDFIETKSEYDWWRTSPIIEIEGDDHGNYSIETANTIYNLKEVE